jgi:hypothetical protein
MSNSFRNSGHGEHQNHYHKDENHLERRQAKRWLERELWDTVPCPTRSVLHPCHYYERKSSLPNGQAYRYHQGPSHMSIQDFRLEVLPLNASSVIFFENEPWWYGVVGYELKVRHVKLMTHLPLRSCLDKSTPIRGLMRKLTNEEIDDYYRLCKRDRKKATYSSKSKYYVLEQECERLHLPLTHAQEQRKHRRLLHHRRKWLRDLVEARKLRLEEALVEGETNQSRIDELYERLALAKRIALRFSPAA